VVAMVLLGVRGGCYGEVFMSLKFHKCMT